MAPGAGQSFPSSPELIIFVCASVKRAALSIKLFPYNDSIFGLSADLNNTRQRDFVKVRTKTSFFIENLSRVH